MEQIRLGVINRVRVVKEEQTCYRLIPSYTSWFGWKYNPERISDGFLSIPKEKLDYYDMKLVDGLCFFKANVIIETTSNKHRIYFETNKKAEEYADDLIQKTGKEFIKI